MLHKGHCKSSMHLVLEFCLIVHIFLELPMTDYEFLKNATISKTTTTIITFTIATTDNRSTKSLYTYISK